MLSHFLFFPLPFLLKLKKTTILTSRLRKSSPRKRTNAWNRFRVTSSPFAAWSFTSYSVRHLIKTTFVILHCFVFLKKLNNTAICWFGCPQQQTVTTTSHCPDPLFPKERALSPKLCSLTFPKKALCFKKLIGILSSSYIVTYSLWIFFTFLDVKNFARSLKIYRNAWAPTTLKRKWIFKSTILIISIISEKHYSEENLPIGTTTQKAAKLVSLPQHLNASTDFRPSSYFPLNWPNASEKNPRAHDQGCTRYLN